MCISGVDVVIHVASPLFDSSTPQVILDVRGACAQIQVHVVLKKYFQSAVSGTTRILDAALAAGVKQYIITASIVSLIATTDFWKEITITEKCESSQPKSGSS
jgi:nucleoside-diphosphate-sugar epimerase